MLHPKSQALNQRHPGWSPSLSGQSYLTRQPRERTVRHRLYRLPLPAFAASGAAHLAVGNESSRLIPFSALSEKAPHLPSPPSAPTGARIQPPSRAGGRHNRRPAQPLPRRPASRTANMTLWHLLCKCEGPTPPRGETVELSGGDRPGWPQPDKKAQQTGSIRWLKPGGRPLRPIHATSAQRYG